MTTPSSRVIIVGAGVFGLSTALHLAEAGYTNVTVFDYQPYDQTIYDPEQGCDSASSDINKIYRCS
jgi:sarcosine oxidase/L-pipecolate oxidase